MAAPRDPVARVRRPPRSLVEKIQEIAARSPADYAALDVLADTVLKRLDEAEAQHPARSP